MNRLLLAPPEFALLVGVCRPPSLQSCGQTSPRSSVREVEVIEVKVANVQEPEFTVPFVKTVLLKQFILANYKKHNYIDILI